MFKTVLQRANIVFLLCLCVFFITIQSTIFTIPPLTWIKPDFILICVTYVGFRRGLVEGGIFTVLCGLFVEASSSSGQHFYMSVYTYCFLAAHFMGRVSMQPTYASSTLVVTGLTILRGILTLCVLSFSGRTSVSMSSFFIKLLPQIIVHAALTPPLFSLLQTIDLKTYRDDHAEDEYDLNKTF